MRLTWVNESRAKMEELKSRFPDGVDYMIAYDTTPFIRESVADVVQDFVRGDNFGRPSGLGLSAKLAGRADSHDCRARGHRRHLRRDGRCQISV